MTHCAGRPITAETTSAPSVVSDGSVIDVKDTGFSSNKSRSERSAKECVKLEVKRSMKFLGGRLLKGSRAEFVAEAVCINVDDPSHRYMTCKQHFKFVDGYKVKRDHVTKRKTEKPIKIRVRDGCLCS